MTGGPCCSNNSKDMASQATRVARLSLLTALIPARERTDQLLRAMVRPLLRVVYAPFPVIPKTSMLMVLLSPMAPRKGSTDLLAWADKAKFR